MKGYPQFDISMEVRDIESHILYVVGLNPDHSTGDMFFERCQQGRAPTWIRVPFEGPTYHRILSKPGTYDRIAEIVEAARWRLIGGSS